MEVETDTKKAYFARFNDPLTDDNDFVEVTEWSNGEGIDIAFQGKHLSLTWSEWWNLKDLMEIVD